MAFALAPPVNGGSARTASILHKFINGADAAIRDALIPPRDGRPNWRSVTKVTFTNDANSSNPTGTLVLRDGTIFALKP